jgi:hypothetical protein
LIKKELKQTQEQEDKNMPPAQVNPGAVLSIKIYSSRKFFSNAVSYS